MSISTEQKNQFLLIIGKLLENNNQIRNNAQSQITEIISNNTEESLLSCSEFLNDDSIKLELRQLSSTIICNILKSSQNINKWILMNNKLQQNIKNNIFACLGSSNKDLRKAAGRSVTAIAKIELGRGNWTNLISTLTNILNNNNNIDYKLASITTIGFIVDEVSYNDINTEDRNLITTSIFSVFSNIKDNEEITFECLVTLGNYIPFLKEDLKNDEKRFYLINLMLVFIKENYSDRIKNAAINALMDVAKNFYYLINDSLNQITSELFQIIKSPNENVGINAYLFFVELGDYELKLIENNQKLNNYILNYYPKLWECCKYTLLNRNLEYEKTDKENFTRFKAVNYILDILSKICDENFIDEVFNFMSKCLNDSNDLIKNSAIYLYSSILETVHKQKVKNIIESSLPKIIEFINSNNSELQQTGAICLQRITHFFPETFIDKKELFDNYVDFLLNKLQVPQKNLSVNFCFMFHYLTVGIKLNSKNYFSNKLSEILNTLLKLAYVPESYNNDDNISLHCFWALGSIIEICDKNNKTELLNFFSLIYDGLQKTLVNENFNSKNKQYDFQKFLCCIITAFCSSDKIDMTEEQGNALYELIKKTFQLRNGIYEEGVLAVSSLSLPLCINKNCYMNILNDFMQFIIYGLNNYQEVDNCAKTIFCIGDIIDHVKNDFSFYIDKIMPILFDLINKEDIDKKLRIQTFYVFESMFFSLNSENFWKYSADIMSFIEKAAKCAFIISDPNDEDLIEYYNDLRERLVFTISAAIRAYIENNRLIEFNIYLENICDFLNIYCNAKYNPKISTVLECCGIFIDFLQNYKSKMKDYFNNETYKYIEGRLLNSRDKDDLDLAESLKHEYFTLSLSCNNFNF